jgi:hypothetical protein
MYPDERQEYIAAIEAWENLPLPIKIKTPKPVIKSKKGQL